jgi:hypothetical protein
MAKLNYWVAECLNDHPCYSIIGKTKKEVIRKLKEHGYTCADFGVAYEFPEKRELYYKDAFHLFDWATGEGGGRV